MAGYTTVSSSALRDASGNLISNATISFTPVTNKGAVVPFLTGGSQTGVTSFRAVTTQVNNGQFSVQLADTSLTSPVNIGYSVSILDNLSKTELLGPGYDCYQPTGNTANFDTVAPNIPAQVSIQTGPAGPTGAPGVASLNQIAALRLKSPTAPNLFNPATVTAGKYVQGNDGTLGNYGTVASDLIPANSGSVMVMNVTPFYVGNGKLAFYDGNGVFVSSYQTPISAGVPFAIPNNAAYIRFALSPTDVAGAMVVAGSVLPSQYLPFGSFRPDPPQYATAFEAVNKSQQVSYLSDPTIRNLFNPASIVRGTKQSLDGNIYGQADVKFYVSADIPVIAGMTYTQATTYSASEPSFGNVWLDANKNVVGSIPFPHPAPLVMTAPANAVYLRICSRLSTGYVTDDYLSVQMVVRGSTLPANVDGSTLYLPYGLSANTYVKTTQGLKWGLIGDSFSNWFSQVWQNEVVRRTGMQLVWQDARGGRRWPEAFEGYGTVTPGANVGSLTYGTPNAVVSSSFYTQWWKAPPIGSPAGSTLAQNIANLDCVLLELGENDSKSGSLPIGSPTDAANAGTMCGAMNWVIASLIAAKPTIRIFGIGTSYRNDAPLANQTAVVNAEAAVYASWGIPFLDTFHTLGINSTTVNTFTIDGIHLTTDAFVKRWAATISNWLMQQF